MVGDFSQGTEAEFGNFPIQHRSTALGHREQLCLSQRGLILLSLCSPKQQHSPGAQRAALSIMSLTGRGLILLSFCSPKQEQVSPSQRSCTGTECSD